MLLSPEKFADAVQSAESAVSDEPVVSGDDSSTEDVVEAKEDSAETETEAEGQSEQSSDEEVAAAAGPEEESADDDDGIVGLSEEDEAWLDKYLAGESSEPDAPDGSEMGSLLKRIAQLEHDRAVSLAERKLSSEIDAASKRYPNVAVDDMIAAVHSNPQIKVDEWASREAKRLAVVESRIEARLRKELKIEKASRADERSPARGKKSKTSSKPSGKKYGNVRDATAALRRDVLSGRFGR